MPSLSSMHGKSQLGCWGFGQTSIDGNHCRTCRCTPWRCLSTMHGKARPGCWGFGQTISDRPSLPNLQVYTLALPVYHAWQGPAWVVAVGCTTLKGSRCEWLVEKSTELGAHGLIPFTTERSQVRFPQHTQRSDASRWSDPHAHTQSVSRSVTDRGPAADHKPGLRLEAGAQHTLQRRISLVRAATAQHSSLPACVCCQ